MKKSDYMANDLRDLGWTVDRWEMGSFSRYHAYREETKMRFAWDDRDPIYVVVYTDDFGSVLTKQVAEAVDLFRQYADIVK